MRFRFTATEDPRSALQKDASKAAVDEVLVHLQRMDKACRRGPWTETVLALIAQRSRTRAPDLAAGLGLETQPFGVRNAPDGHQNMLCRDTRLDAIPRDIGTQTSNVYSTRFIGKHLSTSQSHLATHCSNATAEVKAHIARHHRVQERCIRANLADDADVE